MVSESGGEVKREWQNAESTRNSPGWHPRPAGRFGRLAQSICLATVSGRGCTRRERNASDARRRTLRKPLICNPTRVTSASLRVTWLHFPVAQWFRPSNDGARCSGAGWSSTPSFLGFLFIRVTRGTPACKLPCAQFLLPGQGGQSLARRLCLEVLLFAPF
jgi:hypothetical protein